MMLRYLLTLVLVYLIEFVKCRNSSFESDCSVDLFSASVNYQSLMKLTGNNNIDGILDLCSCLDFVCLILSEPRYIK